MGPGDDADEKDGVTALCIALNSSPLHHLPFLPRHRTQTEARGLVALFGITVTRVRIGSHWERIALIHDGHPR